MGQPLLARATRRGAAVPALAPRRPVGRSAAPPPPPPPPSPPAATIPPALLGATPRPAALKAWCVVAGAFLVLMVGFGAIYSYAAFAEQIGATFGAGRASVALVYALSGGSCFLVSALTGPLADRLGARPLAAIGMLLVASGLMMAAAAGSLVEVYLGYGLLIGIGVGFAYVPAVAAVQGWFDVHRGLASGVAVSGIGIGTALVPPAAEALSALGDWRAAFVACGVLAAVVGVAGAMLILPPPAAAAPEARRGRPTPPPVVLSRDFALVYGGTLLVSLPAVLPHAMLVASARDLGFPLAEAVALLGLIGLGTIAGRFLLAALADAVGRREVFLACCGGMAASMLGWALAEGEAGLQAFALGFGVLQGGFVALLPAFVADSFGARALGGVLGVLYTSRGLALVAAPPALALAIAAVGGHAVPLVAVALAGVAGTALLSAAGRGRAR